MSHGKFRYWPGKPSDVPKFLEAHELQVLLAGGEPDAARGAPAWRCVNSVVPEECRFVLEVFRDVYHNDAVARRRGMSSEERLAFHKAKNGMRIEALRQRMTQQLDEKKVQPNSRLGEAILYTHKRWDRLIRFLELPGIPLDTTLPPRES